MTVTATFRVSLAVKDSTNSGSYQSSPTSFEATLSSFNGPCPGVISVGTSGTQVSLSQLTTPGPVWLHNLDPTNYVEYGIRDPGSGKFYPMGELRAGEMALFRFSRNLLSDYTNTGTGTDGDVNYLWFKANTAACKVRIEAFES